MADVVKEALAGEAKVGGPRQPMLREGSKFSSPSSKPASGKAMKRKNVAAGDPTVEAKPARSNTLNERHGSTYNIVTNIVKQNEPAASATLMNAKVIPSTIKRTADNFGGGMQD